MTSLQGGVIGLQANRVPNGVRVGMPHTLDGARDGGDICGNLGLWAGVRRGLRRECYGAAANAWEGVNPKSSGLDTATVRTAAAIVADVKGSSLQSRRTDPGLTT